MTNYQAIYNKVVETDANYQRAENSPGLRNVIQATDQLSMLSGRCLDVGCGVGFVIDYLSQRPFQFKAFGIDTSDLAVEHTIKRIAGKVPQAAERIKRAESMALPFDDQQFRLVTCFDVLEHLDEEDIFKTLGEISRVMHRGGVFFGAVSCRKSGVLDLNGDNLHRSVRSPDWWIGKTSPDRAIYDGHRKQLVLWKRASFQEGESLFDFASESSERPEPVTKIRADHPADSKDLYQKIYDDNPWYGDASKGRCPGVRLLPHYQAWLVGPVIDLGCGRGQVVEKLREEGVVAEGIDQIRKHPEMMVGDITKPIENLQRFNSAVCIDCIEHLYDEQVQGLFGNMKQVDRQAFSIHNGESTGTGQELHVNRRSFEDWRKIIEADFVIEKEIRLHDNQMLYLTKRLG